MYGTNALHLSLNKYIRFFVYHIRERRNELLLLLLPIVVVEVKYSCVRTIVIVTSTFEERVVRVHKVSVIFSVISLLYHHFSFKSLYWRLYNMVCEIKRSTPYYCVQKEEWMKEITLSDCTKRRLDDTYIVVYAVKNEINIKKADYIEKKWYIYFNWYWY